MNALLKNTAVPAAVIALVAAATLAAAWGFQLIGGFIPCKLCLQERIPYYVGLPLALAAIWVSLSGRPGNLARWLLLAVAIVFLLGAALGAYHAGVEYGWWLGPSDCGVGGGTAAATAEDLLKQLENVRIVSCSEASWRFPAGWGLSFAGWNAVISGFMALVGFAGVQAARRP